MVDLKVINSVLEQLEEERGIPKDKMLQKSLNHEDILPCIAELVLLYILLLKL
jgi:hypothetical protein